MIDDELNSIKDEFHQSSDYGIFVHKYYDHQHPDIQILVVEANWQQIQQQKDHPKYLSNILFFIKKYQQHELGEIRILVLRAMLTQLQLLESEIDFDDFNELCNELIKYTNPLDQQHPIVQEALRYVYWFKGQHLNQKDLLKAQYFYKKVLSYTQQHDLNNNVYAIRSRIALLNLDIEKPLKNSLECDLYELIDEYIDHPEQQIQVDLKNLLTHYIDHEMSVYQPIEDEDQVRILARYLQTHDTVRQMLLELDHAQIDATVLLKIAYLYWWLEQADLGEAYLTAYFNDMPSAVEITERVKHNYYFETTQKQQQFIDYIHQSYEKYRSMQKYRQLFHRQR